MILIFYALRRELGHVRRRIENRSALGNGLRGFRGRIGGEDVTMVATGIGIAQARATARHALQVLPQPRMVISTGVAGGLAPELRAGDLVLANRFLMESSDDGGFESVTVTAEAVQSAHDALHRAGLTAAAGPMLTARRLLSSAAGKRGAHARSGALAVDMESAAIALEMARCTPPFVCVRAIIDAASDELPAAELAEESGEVSMLKAAAYFLKNPSALTQVPAIMKNMGRATAAIASALQALCSRVGE
jgi:adenosylhomocysteine nucleosidase